MKKSFLFLAALAMSVVSMAANATYTKVTSDPTDWSGDYILVYEADGAARVFTGVDAASNFAEATISDNTITGDFVTLTLETTDGGYFVKVNGGNNDGKYFSSNSNANDLKFAEAGAVMSMSYDADNKTTMMVTPAGCVMRYNKTSGQDRFRFFKSSTYTSQQPVQLYKAGGTPTPQKELVSIAVSGTPDKTTYEAGETFNPAGLTVTGTYSDASEKTITSGITWNVTPSGALTAGITSVSVTATVDGITNEPAYVVDGLTVTEHVQTYANTYTSNVELSAEGGTSASAAKVVIGGTEYDAIKAGTSSAAGACVVTIPATTKTLHFHAAGWNKENVVLNETINLVADAGVSNSSPFTLQTDPETQDYFTLDPQGATTITFTATSGKRFVLFGVNAELQEGVVAAPVFTPSESEFDGSVKVTLTADEGADIYFTLDGTTPEVGKSTSYEGSFTLTKTTTIKAIAEKGGKTSEVAEKTYTKIPVFESLEDLVTNLPATDKNVTVIVTITEAKIDSFYVTSQKQTNGVYTHVGETVVELYEYNVPEAWEVGGTLSTTALKAQWGLYKGTAELQKWDGAWDAFTYTAPGEPTGLQQVMMQGNIRKMMHNGRIIIMKGDKMFNLHGMLVK